MLNLTIPLSLLLAHLVGDFFLQSNWMAKNKGKSWRALSLHCFTYTMVVGPAGSWYASSPAMGLWWLPATFLTHFATDAVTSRITSKLWFFEPLGGDFWRAGVGNRHWFFVAIGIDQFIHALTLALTLRFLS